VLAVGQRSETVMLGSASPGVRSGLERSSARAAAQSEIERASANFVHFPSRCFDLRRIDVNS